MMTLGGPPGMFGIPPAKKEQGTISDDLYMELIRLVKALVKRVEILEEKTGITKKPELPCIYCNVLGSHQPWCDTNAKRI